ncbi:MAG: SLC13 family permease [Deinococcota bacterium]|jgi:di/tricarboxylate transporter|nr:SLC13 family permease [Deinococcota bacterium]
MTVEQIIVFATLLGALLLFIWGRWRYDVVALAALLVVTTTGIVDGERAFMGFSHPAVITVAAVLVLSRGLMNAGLVDVIAKQMARVGDRPSLQIGALTGFVAACSSIMNNVGALAIMMPVAIKVARTSGNSPSLLLMPLAFGSLLGGLITLIGTPPNIIIATLRTQAGGERFGMFDFAPVGLAVTAAGILFIMLVGWRLLPQRQGQASQGAMFRIEDYITEVRVPAESELAGRALYDIKAFGEANVVVVGLVRGEQRYAAPSRFEVLRPRDVLILEADPDGLEAIVAATGLELVGSKNVRPSDLSSERISLIEAVVSPGAIMENRTVRSLNLRWRYGINLLAVARRGERLKQRLDKVRFRAGDVLLLQAGSETVGESLANLGCLPLAERGLRLGQKRRLIPAALIFGGAITAAMTGVMAIQVSFVLGALLMVLVGLLTLREAYGALDLPILVLLGAMIPVGEALETSGGAELIASSFLSLAGQMSPVLTLTALLVFTMLLSNIINNAAAAVLMAPIAISLARSLGVSVDPLLMGVAIGASAAFMTPIGHQSNTLVMGPGGYRFGDYWRMGLPVSLLVTAVAVPVILMVWPL